MFFCKKEIVDVKIIKEHNVVIVKTYNGYTIDPNTHDKIMCEVDKCLQKNIKLILDISEIVCLSDVGSMQIVTTFLVKVKKVNGSGVIISSKELENSFVGVLMLFYKQFPVFDVYLDKNSAVYGINSGKRQRNLPKGFWKSLIYIFRLERRSHSTNEN